MKKVMMQGLLAVAVALGASGAAAAADDENGCTSETLRRWVRQAERDGGLRPGPTSSEQQRIKELERENRELRQTNEILKLASAFFAKAELDRHHKK